MKRNIISCLFLFLCLITECLSYGQDGNYSLGRRREFIRSGEMNDVILFKSIIGQITTHKTIGGISFELIAVPADSQLARQSIMLRYHPDASDGNRLEIILGNKNDSNYFPVIPDWQLKPIANYVNSDYNSVFTYYGANYGGSVRYHPAFKDQLLGLRMFQADMIIFGGPDMAYLPKDDTIGVLIAKSERKFKLDTFQFNSYETLSASLDKIYPNANSYILTDWGKEIKFGVSADEFYVTGEPHYLFTSEITDSSMLLQKVKQVLSVIKELPFQNDSSYIQVKRLLGKQYLTPSELNRTASLIDDLSKRYADPFSYWLQLKYFDIKYAENDELPGIKKEILGIENISADQNFILLAKLLSKGIYSWTASEARPYLEKLKIKYGFEISDWNQLEDYYERVQLLLKDSRTTEKFTKEVFDFNPVVLNSCIVTARYAALFRYIKQKNPESWKKFIAAINLNTKPGEDFPWNIKTPYHFQ